MHRTYVFNRSRQAIQAGAVGLLASMAHAKSGVTLYGVADVNVEYVNRLPAHIPESGAGSAGPAHSLMRMSSGGLSGSRWGLRGEEDVGGGLKAVFTLESGFLMDTGAAPRGYAFNRQAFVGLASKSYGTVTFGRQTTTLFDVLGDFSPTYYANLYEPVVVQTGLNLRENNMAKYAGTFGPVKVAAHWSFGDGTYGPGEVPGHFRDNTAYGAGVSYSTGPLGAAVVYDQVNPAATQGGRGAYKKLALAGRYTRGKYSVVGGYRWGQNRDQTGATVMRDDYYWIGATYQATGALSLTLSYYYDNVKQSASSSRGTPWQTSLLVDYALSKRTDFYLTGAYARHAGLNLDSAALMYINGYPLSGRNDMLGVAIGMRHRF